MHSQKKLNPVGIQSDWDRYYFLIASAVASNSKCFSTKVGAILVYDKSIIATGYNGPARGIPRCDHRFEHDPAITAYRKSHEPFPESTGCPRKSLGFKSGEALDLCVATHGEANCIANAARHGVRTFGSTMYITCGIPCKDCLSLIINAGIEEVVCTDLHYYDRESKYIFQNSKLIAREYT